MKTLKTLMIAGATVLSLGSAAAMAQSRGDSFFPDWQSQRILDNNRQPGYDARNPIPTTGPVQSGSSDVAPPEVGGADHTATYILQHHLYGAGGTAG
jgi:hypothetical protein